MQHDSVLPDVLAAVRPLYARMEPMSYAADAAKARAEKCKAQERLEREMELQAGGAKPKARRVDRYSVNRGGVWW